MRDKSNHISFYTQFCKCHHHTQIQSEKSHSFIRYCTMYHNFERVIMSVHNATVNLPPCPNYPLSFRAFISAHSSWVLRVFTIKWNNQTGLYLRHPKAAHKSLKSRKQKEKTVKLCVVISSVVLFRVASHRVRFVRHSLTEPRRGRCA